MSKRSHRRGPADEKPGDARVMPTLGFGVPATSDLHHFKVAIPRTRTAHVQISEHLGLAWAIEHMDMESIPVAVRNWLALKSEERRWLFGMTAMSTGGLGDGQKGWRLALRHSLGDVTQSDLLGPGAGRQFAANLMAHPLPDRFEND